MKNSLTAELDALQAALDAIRARIEPHALVLDALANGARPRKRRTAKRQNAQWQRQGRYLQAIRLLPKTDRAKVKRELKASGYTRAIRLAKTLAADTV